MYLMGATMTSRWVIAGVAAACVAAAGLGGYFAGRTTAPSEAELRAYEAPIATEIPAPGVDQAATPATDVTEPVAPVPTEPSRSERAATPPAAPAPAPARPVASEPERAPAEVPRFVPPPATPTRSEPARAQAPVEAPADARVADARPAEPVPALSAPTSTFPVSSNRSYALDAPPIEIVELAANTVIGIRLDTAVSSETSRVEDEVRARVTRPVEVGGRVVIPTGARLIGYVNDVDRGGRVRDEARIGIRFTRIEIDRRSTEVTTDPIYRAGQSPTGEATAKIGASTVVGSILGGVFGGKRGAVIGGAAGAAGGTAMVMRGDRNEAVLESGTPLTVRLTEAVELEIPD